MDATKNDINATKTKTKPTKKTNLSQYTRDVQSLDTDCIIVTPMNNSCNETLEDECSFLSIDFSHWKDEWQVYAKIISKVIIKNLRFFEYTIHHCVRWSIPNFFLINIFYQVPVVIWAKMTDKLIF